MISYNTLHITLNINIMPQASEKKEKYTNQHELQSKTKAIVDSVQNGNKYIILRYSKPVGVLISMDEYEKLLNEKNCPECIAKMKQAIENTKIK